MDFSLSEEQRLLAESVERFVQNDYGFERRRSILAMEGGFDPANWQTFAELGWLGVPFPEADGGFGGGPLEIMLLMEQLGKGLVLEPLVPTVLLAGRLLQLAGSTAQKEQWLAAIIAGTAQSAFGYAEPRGRFNLCDISTTAVASGDGYQLNGEKAVVLNAPAADFIIVSARTSGERRDRAGVSLFLVARDATGLERRDYPTVDGRSASELVFADTPAELLGEAGAAADVIEQVIDEATVAIGSEAVGAMEVLYKSTVEYCQQREQFGQPIGKFQVLQHRMVDMFMEHEQSKSLMYMASMRLAEGYDDAAKRAVSAFKVQVGKSGRFVGQNAVQLHGGMGMTDELHIGHFFKRLTVIDPLFGNVDYHLRRFGGIAAG